MHFDFLLDFIFPAKCVNCLKYTSNRNFICSDCFSKIEVLDHAKCGECGSRLPETGKHCHKNFPYVLCAATKYETEAVRKMIYGLKFGGLKNLSIPLSKLLLSHAEPLHLKVDLIVPIPLGKKRLRERGYNQAELLAGYVSKKLNVPIANCLIRIKETKPQAELTREERLLNTKGCFGISDTAEIKGKNIILLDDVTTSGSTFIEAAKILKKAGVKKIYALALSKA